MTRKQKIKRLHALKLERLAKQLKSDHLPSQEAIASAVGVDQPLVSRARNGELRRLTSRVERLAKYVNMRIIRLRGSRLSAGPVDPQEIKPKHMVELEALATCQEYLRQGCDPKVLIDQVGLLRRAQFIGAGPQKVDARA